MRPVPPIALTRQDSPELEPHNWRRRGWRRIWERAEIGDRDPKDLRDTYASQLLTAGVSLGYVSAQLGMPTWQSRPGTTPGGAPTSTSSR